MHARLIAAASVAILLTSCSSIYDTSDFAAARSRAAAEAAKGDVAATSETEAAAADAAATGGPAAGAAEAGSGDLTVADADSARVTTAEASSAAAGTGVSEAGTGSGGAEVAEAPAVSAGSDVSEPASTPPVRSLLSMFRLPTTPPAARAAEEAIEGNGEAAAAEPAGPKIITQEEAVRTGVLTENPKAGEFSEADLAGEVEADPDEVAVPDEPWDDGLEHDFVNVYTSRPEAVEPTIPGLPGVTWEKDIVLVSRGPAGDPSDFFGRGATHPFARTVPGIPQKVVQAANGLLLQHAAINVGCVKPQLLNLVRRAETHFGKKVVITSGYRSPAHNRRVRGAKHSQHMFCNALDLYMPGVTRDDLARFFYRQPDRGGIGIYCSMKSIHVDIGKRREWSWPCRKRG